jgi:PKD repeat protein
MELWQWQHSTDASPSHLYTEPGTYEVQLTARNRNGCPSDQASVSIEIFEKPTATLNSINHKLVERL